MNSNVTLHSSSASLHHEEEEISDDMNLDDDADLGGNSQTFDEEIDFNNTSSNTNNNVQQQQIIRVKKEENYYEASQVLDEEASDEEINFDEVQEVQQPFNNQQAPPTIPAITSDEEEEVNFDEAIVVNSDDESVCFDDDLEAPQHASLIRVKVEPGLTSNNSSISVNMDEMDNKMQDDDEDIDLDEQQQEVINETTNVNTSSNNNTLLQQPQVIASTESTTQAKDIIQEESDDLNMEDFDFSMGTSELSSSNLSNIKLAGSHNSIESIQPVSLVTQPTMESLQPSLTIDPSLTLPPSPTQSSPEKVLLTSEEERSIPATLEQPSSTIPTSSVSSSVTSKNASIITQEINNTLGDSALSQYKVKQERGLSNTLEEAITIDSDSEDEVMVEKVRVVPSSLPSQLVIEESENEEEIPEDDDEQLDDEDEDDDEEEDEYSSTSSEEENDEELEEQDAVSTSSGRFKPSLSVKRIATAFRMITKDICTGSFCCGGPLLTRAGLPGLKLIIPNQDPEQEPTLKHVTFPLANPEQAREIIKLAKRAAKHSNEYYLNADQFVITNPKWNEMVSELVNSCTRGNLGVSPEKEVSFQLHQLVLFKEGENIPKKNKLPSNVFAQFIVQLPCSYAGGKVKFSHRDEQLEYDLVEQSFYLPSYITYFTECQVNEDKIEEGYKLYLVYNLIYNGKPSFKPSLETVFKVADNLKKIEALWSPQESPFAVYLLDSVKEADCRVDLLKGQDLVLYNFFTLFNDQYSLFDIYLGVFERTTLRTTKTSSTRKVVNDDEIYDSDDESSYLVKRLTNPKTGVVVSQMFKIELSDTIPYDIASISSNRNCLVVIPKKYHYLSLKYMDAKTCYEGFITLYKEFMIDPTKRNLCIELASSQTQSQFFKGKLLELIPILLNLSDIDLFKKFLIPIPILDLPTWNTILNHFGLDNLKTEFLSGLVGYVCYKTQDLEKRANQTFNYLIGLADDQLSLDFMSRFLEKLDNITNNINTGILSINFLVSLIETCSKLKIESEVIGRISLKIIQTNAIETCTEQIIQVLQALHSQNQIGLCNQIFELIIRRAQPQIFTVIMPVVISSISLLGVDNIKSKIVEFCNKMINTSTIMHALQIIEVSVQKNDDKLLYLSKYFRKGVINCLQISQITLNLCQKVLGVLYRANFKDDISTITSIIIGKSGMIENSIHELLIPLIKWTDKELGKHAFLNPGFNSILQYCINMLRMSIGNTQSSEQDWSLNVSLACNCDVCNSLAFFLRDKVKTKFEYRKAEAQRNHVMLSAKAAAEKYLKFDTVKDRSPYCLVIQKVSTPNDAEKKKAQALKETFEYLTRLSTTVMNLNNPSMATSSSSSSISSTTSNTKRTYPSSSDSDESLRRINKKSK
ncbi:predicted protein [Naegleria gruberi]|uniref:Predicted protein n=1 Tax=Naegleria gruberi TaxID=5762 RepID=D2VTM4_NAEGR|nr:uncharacterized protein NAEGRDRAFT_72355 [Naegleria gruberi]EFC39958.1 predicted protein [Naegleria gruberi]|eukprot:XP_002672702.1 predicted protein [Naegleria gruberi strain NEG-M]